MDFTADAGIAFSAVAEAAPVGILICGGEGDILYANTAFANIFGRPAAWLIGRPAEDLLPERYRRRYAGFRAAFITASRSRASAKENSLLALHADGYEFPIEIGLGHIQYRGETCAIAFVSDRKRGQAEERRFTEAVNALPLGLMIVDEAGMMSFCNPALERMFGYREGELTGQCMEMLVPARSSDKHLQLRQKFARAASVRAIGDGRDLLALRKDGYEFPVEIGLTPLDMPGGKMVLAAIADISVRKAHETAILQMKEQLEEFTYVASHDLRSPLRGIADLMVWIREDLAELTLPEAVQRNFERVDLRIARAEQMIDDMLEYARSGQADARLTMIEPRHLVEEVLALLQAPEHFCIEIDIAGSFFRGAATPLSLALRNVISNSFKHHGRPSARLHISMREDGAFNIFTIADDGVGVPASADERIFKLFQRYSSATPGHGMGLALARRAVNAHGGSIVLDRGNPLGGACFSIRWPRIPKETEHA